MVEEEKLSRVLKKYFELEENQLQNLIDDISKNLDSTDIENSKQSILNNIELHNLAHQIVEEEVVRFREDLYLFAKIIAKRELEEDIITKAHVIKAREFLWRRDKKYNWSDIFLGSGGILLGASIPHIINLIGDSNSIAPNVLLIVIGLIGAACFGMGMITKLKKEK